MKSREQKSVSVECNIATCSLRCTPLLRVSTYLIENTALGDFIALFRTGKGEKALCIWYVRERRFLHIRTAIEFNGAKYTNVSTLLEKHV